MISIIYAKKEPKMSFLAIFSSLIGLSGLILQIMKVLIVPLWILVIYVIFRAMCPFALLVVELTL